MKYFLKNRIRNSNYDDNGKVLMEEIAFMNKALVNYEGLRDEAKYELISHFFDVRFDTKSFLDYINTKQGTEYKTVAPLMSKMETTYSPHDLPRSKAVPARVNYDVAISDDFFPGSKPYSYDEINGLIEAKSIYPIREVPEPIEEFDPENETFRRIPTLIPDELQVVKESFVKDTYHIEKIRGNKAIVYALISQSMPQTELLAHIKFYIEDIIAFYKDNERRLSDKDKEYIEQMKVLYNKYFPQKTSRY